MLVRVAALLLGSTLAACGFEASSDNPGDDRDLQVDAAPPDAACVTFSSLIDTCGQPQGFNYTLLGAHLFDTDAGVLSNADGPVAAKTGRVRFADGTEAMALFVENLGIQGTLTARGTLPFALVATGTIAFVSGGIDVSAGGAAAAATCALAPVPGENDGDGGAGGGGGGFAAAGGRGGNGNGDFGGQSTGGAGGAEVLRPTLVGGCPGANGGDGDGKNHGGAAGAAGGAVFVVAREAITIATDSGINAGGGGGGGGERGDDDGDAGGGGGGAGGMIIVEAPTISGDGMLAANGGGGGEGSGNSAAGHAGTSAPLAMVRAAGGTGGTGTGADGGAGGNAANPAGGSPINVQAGGGGGGGGGVGFIRVISAASALLADHISPAASSP